LRTLWHWVTRTTFVLPGDSNTGACHKHGKWKRQRNPQSSAIELSFTCFRKVGKHERSKQYFTKWEVGECNIVKYTKVSSFEIKSCNMSKRNTLAQGLDSTCQLALFMYPNASTGRNISTSMFVLLNLTSSPGSKGEIKECCRYRLHWLNKSYL
jgi:hypothetical protein